MSSSNPLISLLKTLEAVSIKHGATLKRPDSFLPLNMWINAESEFSRGVLAGIAHVYYELSQSTEGRQAIFNLGFQPLFQKIESPRPAVSQTQQSACGVASKGD
mgnify:CR=1 FL=1